MKVLGIATSPRKGNSQSFVESVLAGAREAGAEVELLRVCDREIKPCIGCGYCKSGNDTCGLKDDMEEIYGKIAEADAIVFGSPIYFARLNAPAYALIDRLWGKMNPDFSSRIPAGKKFVTVLTCGSAGPEVLGPVREYLKTVFAFFDMTEEGYVAQNMCFMPDDYEKYADRIAEAKEVGKNLAA